MKDLSNIKIIFVDIDGTLVTSDKIVTENTKKAIARAVEKGIYIVLISGRDSFHTILKSKEAYASNIIIACNGAEIYDYHNDKLIFIDKIPSEKVKTILDFCDNNGIELLAKSINGRFVNKFVSEKEEEKVLGKNLETVEGYNNINFTQLVMISNNQEVIKKSVDLISELGLVITNYSSSFLEQKPVNRYRLDINNSNINKQTAVTKLLEYLNINKEDSMCFGDFVNDIGMFEAVGFKVAMGNACDELKEKADFVTKTNNEDGIAYVLDNYL